MSSMANNTVISEPISSSGTVEVTMPAPEGATHVEVTAWLKRPGDVVADQEAICLVDWGEGAAEVGSPAGGVLRMVTAAAGQSVVVGATLAVIDVALAPTPGRFSTDLPEA